MKTKKKRILTIIGCGVMTGLAAACSTGATDTATSNPAAPNQTTANRAATIKTGASDQTKIGKDELKIADETPAAVKAVLPDAQSFSKQHKDISPGALADIEKESGAKVPDTDHHSYLAFSNARGTRQQIGAATIVTAAGQNVVIVYESKNGMPMIKEVHADNVPAAFLAQLAGKGHDDKFQVGADLKTNGADKATAQAIAQAVRVDALTMQTLYGAAHSH